MRKNRKKLQTAGIMGQRAREVWKAKSIIPSPEESSSYQTHPAKSAKVGIEQRMTAIPEELITIQRETVDEGGMASRQSLMTPHVERLPFEQRLRLYAALKRFVAGQKRG
ncbi:MAG: hypothetical protein WHX93_18485, partial [bacterium]